MTRTLTGGCLCGRVRYSVSAKSVAERWQAAGLEVPE